MGVREDRWERACKSNTHLHHTFTICQLFLLPVENVNTSSAVGAHLAINYKALATFFILICPEMTVLLRQCLSLPLFLSLPRSSSRSYLIEFLQQFQNLHDIHIYISFVCFWVN